MRTAHNIVLYAFEKNGVIVAGSPQFTRRPIRSFDPSDRMIAPKVTALIGSEIRTADQRGVAVPDFRIVSEQRTADEGGQFVISAKFVELDFLGKPISREFNSLQELLDAKADAVAPQAVPETAEQKAERESRALSASLSV